MACRWDVGKRTAIGVLLALCSFALCAIGSLTAAASQAGDLVLTGSQYVEIVGQTYHQRSDIIVGDNARLVIRDSAIVVDDDYDWQFAIHVQGKGVLELENVTYSSRSGNAIEIIGDENARLGLLSVRGTRYRVMLYGDSTATLQDVKIPEVDLIANARMTATDSEIDSLARMSLGEALTIGLEGLRPGYFEDWATQGVIASGDLSLSLTLHNTSVASWALIARQGTHATISDSDLQSINIQLVNTRGTIRGLRPGFFANWTLGDLGLVPPPSELCLQTTSVSAWALQRGEGCNLTVVDSQVSLWLDGNLTLSATNTVFDMVGLNSMSTASMSFDDCSIESYLRLDQAHVSLAGTARFGREIDLGGWNASSVRRSFEVVVRDASGQPLPQETVQIADRWGHVVSSGPTNGEGRYTFEITFTDTNHSGSWSVGLPGYTTTPLTFFSASPLVIVAR